MSSVRHPHRILEYAPSGRSYCKGRCKERIKQGQLRFGTKVQIEDNQGISWRCMKCITKNQVRNLFSVAKKEEGSEGLMTEFLTHPPAPSAGGDGPEDAVVEEFTQYVYAIRDDDIEEATQRLRYLNTHTMRKQEGNILKRKSAAVKADTHSLDHQAREDFAILDLLSLADVRALCEHHKLNSNGIKAALEGRLAVYYAMHPEVSKANLEKEKIGDTKKSKVSKESKVQ